MRSPASELSRALLWVALAAALVEPVSGQVIVRFGEGPAFSDTPIPVRLDYFAGCWGPEPLGLPEGPDERGVFRVLWGSPPGIACTEDPRIWANSAEMTVGPLPAGRYVLELRSEDGVKVAFGEVRVFDRPPCVGAETELCLHGGRFATTVSWRDFAGGQGLGHAVPRDPAAPFLADTGFLWFFSPDNYELMVKLLDGCALNGHFWVFVSPGSTVEYTIEITDRTTAARRSYRNELGAVPKLIVDTSAFPCS